VKDTESEVFLRRPICFLRRPICFASMELTIPTTVSAVSTLCPEESAWPLQLL